MAYQLRRFFALVLICFTATFSVDQGAPTAGKHPKIGLVLQGGGALGLAHVGGYS